MDVESSDESPPFATGSAADQQRQHVHMTTTSSVRDDDTCILGGCADHLQVDSDDEADDDNDALPFALSHGSRDQLLSESFLKANDALGLSLAATTISTRSAASDDMSVHDHHQHQPRHRQQTWPASPRTSDQDGDPSEAFFTPRSHAHVEHQSPPEQAAVRDPGLSSGSEKDVILNLSAEQTPNDKMKPSPNCISQPVLGIRKQSGMFPTPRRRYDTNDCDDRPSPAAAAAAEAAAALYLASPPQPTAAAASTASSSPSSSFILQSPQDGSYDHEHEIRYPILQRRDSPRDESESTTSTSNEEVMSGGRAATAPSDLMEAPLFPTQSLLTGDDHSDGSAAHLYQSTMSLGFSELMHKAENGGGAAGGGGDSFALVSSPLRPVIEETLSKEESKDGDAACSEDDRTSHASTPPMSNVGVCGATIVPASPSPMNLPSAIAATQHNMAISPPQQQRSRRSPYRTMGPSVHTTQLSEDSFSVSTHLPSPCSVREVVDVLANPDLLRLWCVPVKNAIITSEGVGADGGISGAGSYGGGGREYDGEWVEITTPQLVSPSSSCTSCLYRGLTATKAALGFETEGYVKMFVERNRGQVGLSVGPFMGAMVADHTITVGDNCALLETSEVHAGSGSSLPSVAQSNNNGVMITDTVRVRKDEDLVATEGGYSCGLFGVLERYALPSISGYMTQAALSLENLCDIVCDGEACALAGTCSVDFSEDRGLGDDGCDGRTPLLAQG